MKKIVLILFVVILSFYIQKLQAQTITSGTCGDNCTWNFSEGTLKVVGEIQNYADGGNTPWFVLNSQIKTIDASECTALGSCSFEDLPEFTQVIMPQSITYIPPEAFRNCQSLKTLELPDDVEIVDFGAFSRMYALESLTISDTTVFVADGVFDDSNLPIIYCKGDISVCQSNLEQTGLADVLTVVTAPKSKCNSEKYYWSGTSCDDKKNGISCANHHKFGGTYCQRVIYTIDEANQVAGDKNRVSIKYR